MTGKKIAYSETDFRTKGENRMKKISVLLVCFMMLFAFVSCDNGGSSPAETVKTTATPEQIDIVEIVVNTLIKEEVTANIEKKEINIDKDDLSVSSDAGLITGSLKATGSSYYNGSVTVIAKLECGGRSITLDGSLSWTANQTPPYEISVDTSKLIATIDNETVSGKDIVVDISIWDIL